MSAQHTRAALGRGSNTSPILPKSTCSSSPGSPSATRTVVPRPRRGPHSSGAVALQGPLGDHHSLAGQQLGGLDYGQAVVDQPGLDCSWWASSSRQASPCPSGRWGRTFSHTLAMKLVVQLVLAAVPVQAGSTAAAT